MISQNGGFQNENRLSDPDRDPDLDQIVHGGRSLWDTYAQIFLETSAAIIGRDINENVEKRPISQ